MSMLVRTARPTAGAYAWFGFMIASWLAFAVLAVASEATLTDMQDWVVGLPLALELIVWFLTFPWMLALTVWKGGWTETARVLVVIAIASAWMLVSIPRPRKP